MTITGDWHQREAVTPGLTLNLTRAAAHVIAMNRLMGTFRRTS